MLLSGKKSKKQSLMFRISSVFLVMIMIISMVMPMVYAEDAHTEPAEGNTETEQPGDSGTKESTLKQLEKAIGDNYVLLTEDIQKAGVTNFNFAEAIRVSINAQPDAFTGVENNKKRETSAEEENEAEKIEKIKYILNHFSGDINATGQQIDNIEGIRLLRKANLIDLRQNNIESLMPMSAEGSEEITRYFGSYGRNTIIDVRENLLLAEYPSQIGGRIILKESDYFPMTDLPLPEEWASDLLEDDATGGIGIVNFKASLRCDNEPIRLNEDGIELIGNSQSDSEIKEIKIVDTYANKVIGPISLTGIKTSRKIIASIPTGIEMRYSTASSELDALTKKSTTFKWKKEFNVQLYTKVTVESQTKGKVTISKIDKVEKNGVPGAEFTLYQKDAQGNEKIKEVKVTNQDGKAIFDELEPGDYVVKETKEPEGYKELTDEEREQQKKSFTVSDGNSIQVTSNSPNPITVNNGSGDRTLEKLENGAYIASGSKNEKIKLNVTEDKNSKLKKLVVNWTIGTGIDGGSGSAEFERKEGEEKEAFIERVTSIIEEKSIDKYKNTKVMATFENADENKKELVFEVANEPKVGKLAITKKVENPENIEIPENEEFDFKVELWGKAENELKKEYPYRICNSEGKLEKEGTITSRGIITLKDGERAVIDNLPIGGKFKVTELLKDEQGYIVDSELSYQDAEDKLQSIEKNTNEIEGSIEKEEQIVEVKVTNTATRYKLSVRKEDENKKPLEGAEFTLYHKDESGSTVDGLDGNYTVHGSGKTKLDETGKVAAVTFENLRAGETYYLMETEVPTGYQKMKEPVEFQVKKGEILAEGQSVKRVPGTKDEFYVVIGNKLNISLPKTGIENISWYTIVGTLLIAGAAVGGAFQYRRKRNYE